MCMSILRDPMLQPPGIATLRLAAARDEGAEHGRRRAHLRDEIVGGLNAFDVCRVDLEGMIGARHRRPEPAENLGHDRDVGDVGDVGDAGHARREQ